MELLACTAGLSLLARLGLDGSVYTDCQGLVTSLSKDTPLRRGSTKVGYHLLRACHRILSTTSIRLQWTRSHPETSDSPVSGWSPDQWGIYLADLYASPHPKPLLRQFTVTTLDLDVTAIPLMASHPSDWLWCHAQQHPLLGSLAGAAQWTDLWHYL